MCESHILSWSHIHIDRHWHLLSLQPCSNMQQEVAKTALGKGLKTKLNDFAILVFLYYAYLQRHNLQ